MIVNSDPWPSLVFPLKIEGYLIEINSISTLNPDGPLCIFVLVALRFWVLLKTTFGPDNPKHEGNQAVYQIDLRRYVSGTESFAETEPMHQLRDIMV